MMPETINIGAAYPDHVVGSGAEDQFPIFIIRAGLEAFGMLNIMFVIICHCNGVSDRQLRRELRQGVSCPDELARRCGAGTDCGGCMQFIEDLLVDVPVGSERPVRLAS